MNAKLELVEIKEDVIATSCTEAGMSLSSYEFAGSDGCGWWLNGADAEKADGVMAKTINDDFIYYNEKGKKVTVKNDSDTDSLYNFYLEEERWFHFKDLGNGNYKLQLCDNTEHHHQGV